jgi:hypothetical protein
MNSLAKYDAARFALQQAVEIDEVKDIRDKAQAMAAYAKQANDTKLIEWATEIKVRAERKAGQMLAEMPKNEGELNNSSWSHAATTTKLSDIGINKSQSSRWQKLAAVPDDQFEQSIAAAKEVAGEITTAAMLRLERANNPKPEKVKHEPVIERQTIDTEILDALEMENEQLHDAIESVSEQNELLKNIAACAIAPEELRDELENRLNELTAENKKLRYDLEVMTDANNRLTNQCATMQEQMNSMSRRLMRAAKNDSAS